MAAGDRPPPWGFLIGAASIAALGLAFYLAVDPGAFPPTAAGGPIVIAGGFVFDTTTSSTRAATVVIEDGRITCVAETCQRPAGARMLDAAGKTVMPGLIDLHVHFFAPVGEQIGRPYILSLVDNMRHRPMVRRAFIEHGVTSIRSAGDLGTQILQVRDAIRDAEIGGPRIFAAGPHHTAVGGHPAGTFYRGNPALQEQGTEQLATAKQAKFAVQRWADRGVDLIKAVYEGLDQVPRMEREVLDALITAAHERKLPVTVHVGTASDAADAVAAGADGIEHGHFDGQPIGAALLAQMVEGGVGWNPTLAATESIIGAADDASMDDRSVAHAKRLKGWWRAAILPNVRRGAAAGLIIGVGTDTLGPTMRFGDSVHRELELLVQAGLQPRQALVAATRNGAIQLGDEGLGAIAEGKLADVLIIDGLPHRQIGDIRNRKTVILRGAVVEFD